MDRNLLGRATEGTDAPTPGYLYVDLAKAATANPNACVDMAQYLTRKLQNKQNPNIKAKCCKVIAKLSEQVPRNQFRRCIAQDPSAVAAIKEAINFRGPMDPVQGDAKNENVRAAAREALEAVYRETPSSEAPTGTSMHGISASYGSSPYGGGGGGGGGGFAGGGSRKMEGIGNPMYSDPRNEPRYNGTVPANFVEAMKEAGEVVKGMIQDPLARNVGQNSNIPSRGHSGNLPGYGNNRNATGFSSLPPGAAALRAQTNGEWTMASNRGPGAVTGSAPSEYYKERDTSFNNMYSNSSGQTTSASAGRVGGSWGGTPSGQGNYGTPSVTINHNPSASPSVADAATASDGTYEKGLIMELCPPGGLKPVPPPDKLANFARAVGNLNPDLICPVLLDLLEDGQPWIIRAKALCVMESAVQNGVAADGNNPYKTFFHACGAEIQPLASHPRAAISDPAKRLLLKLGIAQGPSADFPQTAKAATATTTTTAAPNLLDFDESPPAVPSVAPPSQPPPPPPSEAPPVPPAAASSSNMFGGMTVKQNKTTAPNSVSSPAAAPPVAPPPPPARGEALLDFTDAAAPPPVGDPFVPEPSAINNMFGDLSVKENLATSEDDSAVADKPIDIAPTTGSAFGFINASAPISAETAPETAPPESAPAPTPPTVPKATFDPLKGGAMPMGMPTSMSPQLPQQNVMTLTPQQMQALAYQQMMMQQMQMAMAMQQQAGGVRTKGQTTIPGQFRSSGGGPGLTFGAPPQARKDDKKFDFIKDSMSASMKK